MSAWQPSRIAWTWDVCILNPDSENYDKYSTKFQTAPLYSMAASRGRGSTSKKGTFLLMKKGIFLSKKGHIYPLYKRGGDLPPMPPVPRPLAASCVGAQRQSHARSNKRGLVMIIYIKINKLHWMWIFMEMSEKIEKCMNISYLSLLIGCLYSYWTATCDIQVKMKAISLKSKLLKSL